MPIYFVKCDYSSPVSGYEWAVMINQPWSFAPYWLQQHIARYNILVYQVFRDRGIVGRLKHVGGCNAAPIWNWPLSRLVGGWLSKKGWNPPEGSSCNTKSAGDWLIKAATVYLSRSTGCLNLSTLHNYPCKIWREPGYTQTAARYFWTIKFILYLYNYTVSKLLLEMILIFFSLLPPPISAPPPWGPPEDLFMSSFMRPVIAPSNWRPAIDFRGQKDNFFQMLFKQWDSFSCWLFIFCVCYLSKVSFHNVVSISSGRLITSMEETGQW